MGERGFPTNPLSVRNRHRRIATGRPQPTLGRPPMPLDFVNRPEAEVWVRMCETLEDLGVMTTADWGQLERYCRLFIAFRDCCSFLAKNGHTYTLTSPNAQVPNIGMLPGSSPPRYAVALIAYPQVKMRDSLDKSLRAIETAFGMSPGARVRLTVEDTGSVEAGVPVVRARVRG